MSKVDQAKEHYAQKLEEFRGKADQYSHAINVRKKLIEEMADMLRSLKEIRKDLARKNKPVRRICQLQKQFTDDYNMHVAVLCNLKGMLADTREEAFLLETLLKD